MSDITAFPAYLMRNRRRPRLTCGTLWYTEQERSQPVSAGDSCLRRKRGVGQRDGSLFEMRSVACYLIRVADSLLQPFSLLFPFCCGIFPSDNKAFTGERVQHFIFQMLHNLTGSLVQLQAYLPAFLFNVFNEVEYVPKKAATEIAANESSLIRTSRQSVAANERISITLRI